VQLAGGLRAFVVAERRVEGNTTICFHIKVRVWYLRQADGTGLFVSGAVADGRRQRRVRAWGAIEWLVSEM
jgi:hypothetical protein